MQVRNTVQRQIVLQTVQRMHDHPTADTVYAAVVAEHPSISKATVYRNLNQLSAQGEIRRVSVPSGADRFDFCTEKHYHVCCRKCGGVFDVFMAHTDDLINDIADSSGVRVERYDILFEGVCSACQGGKIE